MGGDFTHSWLSLPLSHSTFQSKAGTSIFRGTEFDPYPYGTEVDLTIKHCGLPAAMMNELPANSVAAPSTIKIQS
jgi:hypothetical protein